MSASAGRVLLIPKGTYDAATTYEMLDLVRYGKSTFVCKKTSTGNTPDSNQDTEYWQLIATSGDVSGVKGNAEATYREGNVNLTFADLGIDSALSSTSDNAVKNKAVYAALGTKQDILTFDTAPTSNSTNPVTSDGIKTALDGKLSATSDTTTNVTSFTSSDDSTSTDKTSDGMTEVITMTSGESHSSLFQKISKMFLNIRKLWNTVGTEDISGIGQTITGAINNLFERFKFQQITISGTMPAVDHNSISAYPYVSIDFTPTIPSGYSIYTVIPVCTGGSSGIMLIDLVPTPPKCVVVPNAIDNHARPTTITLTIIYKKN